ncbi:hypothetical protein LINGRAHAP2_LOCUS9509, partial [Linum grandiflorum]
RPPCDASKHFCTASLISITTEVLSFSFSEPSTPLGFSFKKRVAVELYPSLGCDSSLFFIFTELQPTTSASSGTTSEQKART